MEINLDSYCSLVDFSNLGIFIWCEANLTIFTLARLVLMSLNNFDIHWSSTCRQIPCTPFPIIHLYKHLKDSPVLQSSHYVQGPEKGRTTYISILISQNCPQLGNHDQTIIYFTCFTWRKHVDHLCRWVEGVKRQIHAIYFNCAYELWSQFVISLWKTMNPCVFRYDKQLRCSL